MSNLILLNDFSLILINRIDSFDLSLLLIFSNFYLLDSRNYIRSPLYSYLRFLELLSSELLEFYLFLGFCFFPSYLNSLLLVFYYGKPQLYLFNFVL